MSARGGRRIALFLLFGGLLAFVVGSTTQIVQQVFFAPVGPMPYASCRDGLVHLHDAVDRAHAAAGGEAEVELALGRFREALLPEWTHFEAIRVACSASPSGQHGLDAVERLRYAEEFAVRREATGLEVLRKQVAKELSSVPGDITPSAPDTERAESQGR